MASNKQRYKNAMAAVTLAQWQQAMRARKEKARKASEDAMRRYAEYVRRSRPRL